MQLIKKMLHSPILLISWTGGMGLIAENQNKSVSSIFFYASWCI